MRNIWAIFRRELNVYFTSPIAYAIIFIFLIVSGYFFYSSVAYYVMVSFQAARNPFVEGLNLVDMVISPLLGNMSVILLLMLPVTTMRLFAEEKKSGSIELLFSFPVRDMEVLLGKYLAALAVFTVMAGLTLLHQVVLWGMGVGAPGVVLAGYVGVFLMGAAFIALGVFVSSLTENQIVAAVVSFGLLILFWIIGFSSSMVGRGMGRVLEYVSLTRHVVGFARGVIDTADVAYYLCFTALFLFLTLRSLESKRWRG